MGLNSFDRVSFFMYNRVVSKSRGPAGSCQDFEDQCCCRPANKLSQFQNLSELRFSHFGGGALSDLKLQIKELMISALELEDIKPENINDSAPIFGEGLGLDSIDALELGVALKKRFGVKLSAESADNKKHFASVDALAAYISAETAGSPVL
jgi:acyl carrier protein